MSSPVTSLQLVGKTNRFSASLRWALVSALLASGCAARAAEAYDLEKPGCTVQNQKEASQILVEASMLADQHRFEAAREKIRGAKLSEDPACPVYVSMLAQEALIEFKAGRTGESIAAAETALALPDAAHLMGLKKTAITYYVLGSTYALVHRFENAEQAFLKSLQLMALDGKDGMVRGARVYADLSYLYMQWGKMKQAEVSLQKSAELESQGSEHTHTQELLRRDTVCHMDMEKGRLSEALRATKRLVDDYGADTQIPADIRAHVYRDYGQLAYRFGQLEESTDSLLKCRQLEEAAGTTPNAALTLATLAQVKILQKRFEVAGLMLRQAEEKMLPFAKDFPVNAAQVAIASGNCWQAQNRWVDARAAFLRGIEAVRSSGSASELLTLCLQGAALADHHLGNRSEERSLRKQAKESASLVVPRVPNANTVDVLTFRAR